MSGCRITCPASAASPASAAGWIATWRGPSPDPPPCSCSRTSSAAPRCRTPLPYSSASEESCCCGAGIRRPSRARSGPVSAHGDRDCCLGNPWQDLGRGRFWPQGFLVGCPALTLVETRPGRLAVSLGVSPLSDAALGITSYTELAIDHDIAYHSPSLMTAATEWLRRPS